jgi:hypothetical protein
LNPSPALLSNPVQTLARRLVLARRPPPASRALLLLRPSVPSRLASGGGGGGSSRPQHDVTEHDVASFYSYLESHPTAQQLEAFARSPRGRAVVEHLRANEGASDADVAALLRPAADDPLLVRPRPFISLPFQSQNRW